MAIVDDQIIANRMYEAKIMLRNVPSLDRQLLIGVAGETIACLLSACPQLAASAYMYHHNLIAKVLYWHLYIFSLPLSWFTHYPLSVVENTSFYRTLWS